jgi:hypothetical protein
MASMGEKVYPVIKGICMNRMAPQAASALDSGCEIARNAAM